MERLRRRRRHRDTTKAQPPHGRLPPPPTKPRRSLSDGPCAVRRAVRRDVAMRRAPCAVRRFEPTTAPVRARAVTTVQNAGSDPGRSRTTSRPRTHLEGSAMTCCWASPPWFTDASRLRRSPWLQGSDDNSTHSDKLVFQGSEIIFGVISFQEQQVPYHAPKGGMVGIVKWRRVRIVSGLFI